MRTLVRKAFVLLEVTVSLILLGIAVAALMRSFSLSMNAIHRNDISTQAHVLAESVLQNLELQPPTSELSDGTFEEDGFPFYSYTMEYKEEEIDYKHLETVNKIENLRPLRHVHLVIKYDNKRTRKFTPVDVELYLPPVERFSYQSKFMNEMFRDEEEE